MLLFILFVVVLLVGIGLLILKETKFEWDSILYNISFILGAVFSAIAGLGVIICSVAAIVTNFPSLKNKVKIDLDQRIEEIQSDYNYIQSITDDKARSVADVEYNKEVNQFKTQLQSEQYYLNNIWLNWYTCPVYNDYDVEIVVYIKQIKDKSE